MLQGIHFLIALMLFSPAVMADRIKEAMARCESGGGTVIPDRVSERQLVDTEEKGNIIKRTYRTCQDVLCYRATAGMEKVDFTNIAEFNEWRNENGVNRGAAEVVFDNNVCKDDIETTEVQLGEYYPDDNQEQQQQGSSSGSTSGSGGIAIRINGELLTCSSSNVEDCIRELGLNVGADWSFTRGGTDRDGRSIYVVRRGGGSTGSDIYIGADIDLGRDSGRVTRRGGYIYINNERFRCSASESTNECLRRIGISADGQFDVDCKNCGFRVTTRERRNSGAAGILHGVAGVVGALAPPLFGYLGVRAQAGAYKGAHQAWAGAASTGFEQCQIMQTSYLEQTYKHISSNELPDREVDAPGCNGYQLGQFPGMRGLFGNGYGGFGSSWGSAGYSPGFMAGMYGPGRGYSPHLGVTGMGMHPGLGLYPGAGGGAGFGLQGNLNLNSLLGLPPQGIGFGGGVGLNTGMNTGFGMGMPGYGGGGYGMGMPGYGGGFGMGMPGYGGGISCIRAPCPGAGGFGGGFGWGGNATINPFGGATAWGGVPGHGGGSYWNNTGGWGGQGGWGGHGGSVNGNNWYAVQNAQSMNAQASQYGNMNQQIALQNQAGQAAYNTQYGAGGGFGYAPYAPANAGFSINAGFGLGAPWM